MLKMWHSGMFLPSLYREYSESETKGIRQYLNLLRLWNVAKENINEYWFGTPTWKFKVSWIFPEHIARTIGVPSYMLSRVPCDNALCLKSIPKMADEDIYPKSITDAWIQHHIHEQG